MLQRAAPLGFEALTVSSAAQKLTPPAGADFALIAATGNAINWRDDGISPTATVGIPMIVGAAPLEYGGPLEDIAFIAAAGTAVVMVAYYKLSG